jgi:hypothetical protein
MVMSYDFANRAVIVQPAAGTPLTLTLPSPLRRERRPQNRSANYQRRYLIGTSVEIRFGERERVFDQFDARLPVVRDNDFHNIESEENIGIIQHSEPCQSTTGNALSFFSIDRLERPPEIFASAGFYFNKHQCVIVTTDNIDLTAAPAAEITEEDFVSVTFEVAAR